MGYVSGVTSAIQTQLNALSTSISSNDSDISTLQSGKLANTVNTNINSSEGTRRFYFQNGAGTYIDSASNTYIQYNLSLIHI